MSYYIGYGGAYIATFVYGLFSDDKNKMYMTLDLVAAVVTAFGNLITTKLSKKHELTKLLKFCGIYSPVAAGILFGICFVEAKMGIKFFEGWNSIFFYVFYFIFGIGIGIQELSLFVNIKVKF